MLGGNTDLNLALFNFDDTLAVNVLKDLGTVDKSGSASAVTTLAAFKGTGTTSFSCRSLVVNTQAGGGGNIDVTQNTQAGCGLELVYTYTDAPTADVPEPTSMALVGLALAGAGFATRRRKVA